MYPQFSDIVLRKYPSSVTDQLDLEQGSAMAVLTYADELPPALVLDFFAELNQSVCMYVCVCYSLSLHVRLSVSICVCVSLCE